MEPTREVDKYAANVIFEKDNNSINLFLKFGVPID